MLQKRELSRWLLDHLVHFFERLQTGRASTSYIYIMLAITLVRQPALGRYIDISINILLVLDIST